MSPFSHATALPCGAVPSLQASNFETHVECVPRPRHWGCSSRTTKPAEMLLFYPGADNHRDNQFLRRQSAVEIGSATTLRFEDSKSPRGRNVELARHPQRGQRGSQI